MGKLKIVILATVAVIAIFFIAGAVQNSDRKPDEYTLIFEGDNKAEAWVDIAIQGENGVMYLGSMLLKDSAPTMRDVVETINNKNEGILIGMDNNGIIISVNEYQNETKHWNVYINNKKTSEQNIDAIQVSDYDGITLLYE
ncbi:MAG: hypothetical protein K2J60_15450 [Acetatifactor sp.]|nr:hypothetical protein [Acetatifactor sp.]